MSSLTIQHPKLLHFRTTPAHPGLWHTSTNWLAYLFGSLNIVATVPPYWHTFTCNGCSSWTACHLNVKAVHSFPRQAKSTLHNIEAGWRRHICCAKAMSVSSSESVYVALVIQHASNNNNNNNNNNTFSLFIWFLFCVTAIGHPLMLKQVQYGLVVWQGYVLEYLVVNWFVKRVLFKWFKLR